MGGRPPPAQATSTRCAHGCTRAPPGSLGPLPHPPRMRAAAGPGLCTGVRQGFGGPGKTTSFVQAGACPARARRRGRQGRRWKGQSPRALRAHRARCLQPRGRHSHLLPLSIMPQLEGTLPTESQGGGGRGQKPSQGRTAWAAWAGRAFLERGGGRGRAGGCTVPSAGPSEQRAHPQDSHFDARDCLRGDPVEPVRRGGCRAHAGEGGAGGKHRVSAER